MKIPEYLSKPLYRDYLMGTFCEYYAGLRKISNAFYLLENNAIKNKIESLSARAKEVYSDTDMEYRDSVIRVVDTIIDDIKGTQAEKCNKIGRGERDDLQREIVDIVIKGALLDIIERELQSLGVIVVKIEIGRKIKFVDEETEIVLKDFAQEEGKE